jgi:glycogenin glucosyltransferase
LSAAADVGWPDIFNSGVFVFKPSADTYGKLIKFADEVGSFDGGDQGLLNQYFSNWSTSDSSKRLPFLYNTASTATYSYLPAFKHFNKDVKIIHFIGETKPWVQQINTASRQVQAPKGFGHLQDFLQLWWDLFVDKVHPSLTEDMVSDFELILCVMLVIEIISYPKISTMRNNSRNCLMIVPAYFPRIKIAFDILIDINDFTN